MNELNEMMVNLRARTGLTRKQFCEKFKITEKSMYCYETGATQPMMCIPFMVEKIINYEEKFGAIDPPIYYADACTRLEELFCRTGLNRKGFCYKFRLSKSTYSLWSLRKSVPRPMILFMIETLIDYEKKFGDVIPDPEWSHNIKYAYGL